MNDYVKQATDFLEKAKATCNIMYSGTSYPDWDDKAMHDCYNVTLSTPRGSMTFVFWDNIKNTETREHIWMHRIRQKCPFPTAYDILACLTAYDPGNYEDFCIDYGYNEDSRKAEQTYFAVVKEYTQLRRIFTANQLEELQEIN